VTGFLTQSAWAARLGVSIRTFRRWRAAGLIPPPDCAVPGYPRWSLGLVAKTTLIVKVQKRGLFQRGKAVSHGQQQAAAGAQFGSQSRIHAQHLNSGTDDRP
jgi:hypothetical protein